MWDIALGIQEQGLEEFAASVNALHMGQWVDHGLYDEDEIDGSWGLAFELTLTRTVAGGKRIHFTLNGLDILDALQGDPEVWVHGHTAWELRQIVRRKEWFDQTLFYLDGQLLTPEKVLALGIASHQ